MAIKGKPSASGRTLRIQLIVSVSGSEVDAIQPNSVTDTCWFHQTTIQEEATTIVLSVRVKTRAIRGWTEMDVQVAHD